MLGEEELLAALEVSHSTARRPRVGWAACVGRGRGAQLIPKLCRTLPTPRRPDVAVCHPPASKAGHYQPPQASHPHHGPPVQGPTAPSPPRCLLLKSLCPPFPEVFPTVPEQTYAGYRGEILELAPSSTTSTPRVTCTCWRALARGECAESTLSICS